MTNYQNDIMKLLEGDTPKQKYEFLQMLLQQRFLFCIKFYQQNGVPQQRTIAIAAKTKSEALDKFWNGRNKEDFEVTSCYPIDTLIA